MHILSSDFSRIKYNDIFEGRRNSEWFNNLQGRGYDWEYDYLPLKYGIPSGYESMLEHYKEKHYGFAYLTVGEFIKWFQKYKPNLKAGWATKYEYWEYKVKNRPLEDLPYELPDEVNPVNYIWVEYENEYDCSKWLYDWFKYTDVNMKDFIWFCFDS